MEAKFSRIRCENFCKICNHVRRKICGDMVSGEPVRVGLAGGISKGGLHANSSYSGSAYDSCTTFGDRDAGEETDVVRHCVCDADEFDVGPGWVWRRIRIRIW